MATLKSISLRCSLLGVALCLCLGPARAALFSYSFQFGNFEENGALADGILAYGSFTGNLVGDLVEEIDDITLSFFVTKNGGEETWSSTVTDKIFAARYDDGWVAGPVVSFTASKNNFGFAGGDLKKSEVFLNSYFEMRSNPDFYASAFHNPGNGVGPFDSFDYQVLYSETWTLTKISDSVPDRAGTAWLIAPALLLFGARLHRSRAKAGPR